MVFKAAVVVNDILLTNVLHEDQLLPRALGENKQDNPKDFYAVMRPGAIWTGQK